MEKANKDLVKDYLDTVLDIATKQKTLSEARENARRQISLIAEQKQKIALDIPEGKDAKQVIRENDADITYFAGDFGRLTNGIVGEISYDAESGAAIVSGLVLDIDGNETGEEFSVPVDNIVDPENLADFIRENTEG